MKCKHLLGFWATKNGYECAVCGTRFSREEYEGYKKEQEEKNKNCEHKNTSMIVGVYHSHAVCNDCGKILD